MPARIFLNIALWLLLVCGADAQAQCLRKIVSLQLPEQPFPAALDALGRRCDCHFAFETGTLPEKKVRLQYENKTVQAILDDLLGDAYLYTEEQGYIIVKPAPRIIISGTVRDAANGMPLSMVTV